jgi:hypothetical protein
MLSHSGESLHPALMLAFWTSGWRRRKGSQEQPWGDRVNYDLFSLLFLSVFLRINTEPGRSREGLSDLGLISCGLSTV